MKKVSQRPFKNQMLLLFVPVLVGSVLCIGLFSYFFESHNIKKNASYLVNSTVYQTASLINDKLMTLFSQMISLSTTSAVNNLLIQTEDNSPDGYENILTTYRGMERIYRSYDQEIDSMYFVTNRGVEVKYFTSDVPTYIGLSLTDWMKTYNTSPQGVYWRNDHRNEVFKTKTPHRVISLFRIIGTPDSQSSGIMLFNLNSEYFRKRLDDVNVSENGYMILLSPDGSLVSANMRNQYGLTLAAEEKLRQQLGESGSMTLRSVTNQNMIVTYHPIQVNGWMVAAVMPEKDLYSVPVQFSYLLLLLIVFLISLTIWLSIYMAKSISQPLEYLSDQVIKFDSGDLNVSFRIEAENEIGVLSHGLSYLKKTVNELLEQVKWEQQQKARMQLWVMQEQIKPHFLYNTLGSIRHLINMDQNPQASEMCESLSRFYRLGLSGGQEIVTLREEVDHVKSYLQIQRMRYEKDFEYAVEIDPSLLDMEMLKLSLQPLVENAIYHGIKKTESMGTILISGELRKNCIVLSVFDDGVGMSAEQLEALRQSVNLLPEADHHRNFGLRNVNLRLRLYFGEKSGLRFESVPDVYTQVSIVIPFENGEEGGDRDETQTTDCG